MPTCTTRYHGEITYADDRVIAFPAGVPGFEEHTQFLLLEVPATRPIVFLQSLSTSGLCFITLPVKVVDPGYELAIPDEDAQSLELPAAAAAAGGVLALALITIQSGRPTTANLLAPVVVNMLTRRARQVISTNPAHSHRHPFLPARETVTCS